jgi:hypothetical protein
MSNYINMTADFEKEKNKKASVITLGVAGAMLLLIYVVKWPLPTVSQPQFEEVIEVNLGSGDQGFGNDQPLLPGEPAPAEQTAYNPPQPVKAQTSEAKDVETDDRADNDAPAITKPAVTKPNATKIDDNNKTAKTENTTSPQPVVQAPPKPKAVLGRTTGGQGNGGNGADSYSKGGSEGIAGGTGDQGRPGGVPGGKDYTGTPRRLNAIRTVSFPTQNFEDDFNESGKIALDIVVDANGKLLSATFQPKGSTLSNRKQIDIAIRRAHEIPYPKYEGGFRQTIVVDFKVRG